MTDLSRSEGPLNKWRKRGSYSDLGKLWFQLLHTKAWPVHTWETHMHRAPQADRNCKCLCMWALICVATQGNLLRVKSGFMTMEVLYCHGLTPTSNKVPAMRKKINSVPDKIRTTMYGNACPLTPNTTCSIGAPSLKIKHRANQPLQTNGCSDMYGDAECKEYENNDRLQKYPDVLASWCA